MIAICVGIAVGIMVARGGEGYGVESGGIAANVVRDAVVIQDDSLSRDTVQEQAGSLSSTSGLSMHEVSGVSTNAGPTRLVIPGLALDGTPEPEVTAAAVEPTRDIVEPTPVPVAPLPVSDASAAIDRFLEGSPLAGMGSVFVAAATEYGIDPRLMPAIALWESSKCAFQAAAFNCWGLTSGADALGRLIFRPFGSYEEGIYAVTRTYAGYGVGDYAALCRWVSGKDNCISDYPAKVLATVEGIR